MSNLKYLNREQLLIAKEDCEELIEELGDKLRKMGNSHPAFFSFQEAERLSNKMRGQTERLKWINWYLEKDPNKVIRDFCEMRGYSKNETSDLPSHAARSE